MTRTVAVDREQLAWVAGFFDGEGHVHFSIRRTPRGTSRRQIEVAVSQSDRERLDHLCTVLGVGAVRGPYIPRNERAQPYHIWSVHGFEKVQYMAAALWCWLGPIKREQFRAALSSWLSFTPDIAPCPHGAEKLRCRECRSEWTKRSWETRRKIA